MWDNSRCAEALGRSWIGIDITYLAIALIEQRLQDTYPGIEFEEHGSPRDLSGATALFGSSPKNFEMWAVKQIGGRPNPKWGGDEGIDGVIRFYIDGKEWGATLVSVKGGETVNPSMVRDLLGTVERDNADLGVLITRVPPTKGMIDTATRSASYTWPGTGESYPKIQIITVEEILSGKRLSHPPMHGTFAEAPRHIDGGNQLRFD